MKFATHLCIFNQDRWLLKNLEMIYPHVERIYISYSETPWNYNPNAKNEFKNNFNPDKLKNTKYYDKITFINDAWDLDEDQRNSCLNMAKKDGMDYLFIIDTDEFYSDNSLLKIKESIVSNPTYDYYKTPWICYWKTFDYALVAEDKEIICGYPEIAVNLNKDVKFVRARRLNSNNSFNLSEICHHASYVLTDNECWEKINTWSHSHQFNVKKWYDDTWLKWNENKINLHPITPKTWSIAIKRPLNIDLPEILK